MRKGKTSTTCSKDLEGDDELTGNADAMFNQLYNKKYWVEVAGINDSTPINVWHSSDGDRLKKQKFADFLKFGAAAADVNNTVAPSNKATEHDVEVFGTTRVTVVSKNEQEALKEAVASAQLEKRAYVVAVISEEGPI